MRPPGHHPGHPRARQVQEVRRSGLPLGDSVPLPGRGGRALHPRPGPRRRRRDQDQGQCLRHHHRVHPVHGPPRVLPHVRRLLQAHRFQGADPILHLRRRPLDGAQDQPRRRLHHQGRDRHRGQEHAREGHDRVRLHHHPDPRHRHRARSQGEDGDERDQRRAASPRRRAGPRRG